MPLHRALFVGICAGVLGVAGSTAAVPGGAMLSVSETDATTVVRMRPLDGHGELRPDLWVARTLKHGSCDTPEGVHDPSGKVAGGARCEAGGMILDPCWRERGRSRPSAICMSAPWDQTVVRIRLSKPMVRAPLEDDRQSPWAVELAGGARCVVYGNGAHDSVPPHAVADTVDYRCTAASELFLLRGFDATEPRWVARAVVSTDDGYVRVDDQVIALAYF